MAREKDSDRETANAQQQTGRERKIDGDRETADAQQQTGSERERWRVCDSTRQKDR